MNIRQNQCYLKTELIRNKTNIIQMVSVPPAKFIAPESHASGALCFISSYGGGMVGGDSVSLYIDVGENSGLVLLPQANSRAYTNTDGKIATQFMDIVVRKNSSFIFNADPLVLHKQSKYSQDTKIFLEDGAGAILVDWFAIGRSENGEKFLFSEYTSSLVASNSDSNLLIDKQYFTPALIKYNIAGGFSNYSQMLNIFFIGKLTYIAELLFNSKNLSNNTNFIFSFTRNKNYTILRILGTTRKSLQSLLYILYDIIKDDINIGFDALERKM